MQKNIIAFFIVLSVGLLVLVVRLEGLYRAKHLELQQFMQSFDDKNSGSTQTDQCQANLYELNRALAHAQTIRDKLEQELAVLKNTASDNSHKPSATELTLNEKQTAQLDIVLAKKYAALFSKVTLPQPSVQALRALLIDREKVLSTSFASYYTDQEAITAAVEQQQLLLADIDLSVNLLLGDDHYSTYELLKDSGFEQFQLERLQARFPEGSVLNKRQADNLLMAKLKAKQEYEKALAKTQTLLDEGLGDAAITVLNDALDHYKSHYLKEAEKLISKDQFEVLSRYEKTQFEQQRKSLLQAYQ